MDQKQEREIIDLAKRLKDLDDKIRKAENIEDREKLINTFHKKRKKIQKLFCEAGPLDAIPDPDALDILKKIIMGNYFVVDLETKEREATLEWAREKYGPEGEEIYFGIIEKKLQDQGIEVTDEEVDEELLKITTKFNNEIADKIDPFDYLVRKEKFRPIVVGTRLPKRIYQYYECVRDCFFYGQMLAVIGLCRVLLDVSIGDRYLNLRCKEEGIRTNLYELKNYFEVNFSYKVKQVCNKLGLEKLEKEFIELYKKGSDVLHGKSSKFSLAEKDVLKFVKKVFELVEELYT